LRVKLSSLTVVAPAFAFALACGSVGSTTEARIADRDQVVDSVQVNGSLRLETIDTRLSPGSSSVDTTPTITGTAGAIVIAKSQLGSLCLYEVTGSADTSGDKIGVHIVFTERLTACTAEVRMLQYNATVTAPPGTYSVALVHERNAVVDTIARQSVTVR
jgi:hypothetical protein